MPNAIQRPDYNRAVEKISRQVRLYIGSVWPYLEKAGGILDLPPMNRKAKGESSPAIPEIALEMVEYNRIPSLYFRFYLEFFEGSRKKTATGIAFSEVLKTARDSPASVGRWISADTDETKAMGEAFTEVSEQVAKGVLFVHPNVNPDDIWVVTNPRQAHTQNDGAGSKNQAAAQDRQARQRRQRARAMRIRYAQILELRSAYPDATEAAVREMWSEHKGLGVSTARDVCRFCERHEWPDGSPVAPELRWGAPENEAAA